MKADEVLRRYAEGQRDFSRTDLRGQSFKGKDLSEADFCEADIQRANFAHATLRGVNFRRAKAGRAHSWNLGFTLISVFLLELLGEVVGVIGFVIRVPNIDGNLGNSGISFALFRLATYSLILVSAIACVIYKPVRNAFAITLLLPFVLTGLLDDSILYLRNIFVVFFGVIEGTYTISILMDSTKFYVYNIVEFYLFSTLSFFFVGTYLSQRALLGDNQYAELLKKAITWLTSKDFTSFQGADLTDADFTQANLENTDLRQATLFHTRWHKAINLDRAVVDDTILNDKNVRYLVVHYKIAQETGINKLSTAFKFQWLSMDEDDPLVRFYHKNYTKCNFTGLNLAGADLTGANFTEACLNNANLSGADLSKADLRGAVLNNANLSEADLSEADLREAQVNNANLSGAELKFASLLATDFSRAELIRANFTEANFKGTNLTEANLTEANLTEANLTEANLTRANLTEANLTEANLTRANLTEANLTEANLIRTQALDTTFTQATFTGICLEDWNTNNSTDLNDIVCDYVYLRSEKQERRPSSGNFTSGEFTTLFQKSLETVDLIFQHRIDWEAFLVSFGQLQVESGGMNLSIQSFENKGDGAFVIRVNVPPGTNKEEWEKSFKLKYRRLCKVLSETRSQLKIEQVNSEGLQRERTNYLALANQLASRQIINQNQMINENKAVGEIKAMNESIDQSRKIEITGGTVNASGAAAFSLGDISGIVASSIKELPESHEPDKPSLKKLLDQLQTVIESEPNLTPQEKTEALEKLKEIAEAGKKPQEGEMQKLAKTAIRTLKGMLVELPNATQFVEASTKVLPLITKIFGF